jgi:hypothetical protein
LGAGIALVPVQTSRSLKEEIDGCKLRDHQVEVEIEALFNDLGRHQDGLSGSRAITWAETFKYPLFDPLAIFQDETCVEQV